ncbi:hypothetical protein D3C73_1324470 [compost metagenome]
MIDEDAYKGRYNSTNAGCAENSTYIPLTRSDSLALGSRLNARGIRVIAGRSRSTSPRQ